MANNSIVHVLWWACWKQPLLPFLLSLSLALFPSCWVFSTCSLPSLLCYVRKIEVLRASKWMVKPSFPLLILPFMHVSLVLPFSSFLSSLFLFPPFSRDHPHSTFSSFWTQTYMYSACMPWHELQMDPQPTDDGLFKCADRRGWLDSDPH